MRRAILTAEINAAADPALAQSIYHLPGSIVDGWTAQQTWIMLISSIAMGRRYLTMWRMQSAI